jgi:ESS family glutamate:Na+ symporter
MELSDGILRFESFLAVTIGIVVLFVGKRVNEKAGFLREFSIPEPVTGGLLFSILFWLLHALSGLEVEFALRARDVLLVYFFTTIGINASARDLLAGGRPLAILLAITITFMLAQNLTGVVVANLFGLPSAVGVLGGSVSLIGGHGTAIAWAPTIGENYGVRSAMEIGIASATFGLILASIMGGPIAKFLINRYRLTPTAGEAGECQDVGLTQAQMKEGIDHLDFLDAVLAIHICIIVGYILRDCLATRPINRIVNQAPLCTAFDYYRPAEEVSDKRRDIY